MFGHEKTAGEIIRLFDFYGIIWLVTEDKMSRQFFN